MSNPNIPSARDNARGGSLAGVIVFVVTLALMFFAAAPAQYLLGTWGLVLTELMLAGIALAASVVFHFKLREVFPLSLPTVRQTVAALLVWAGFLGLSFASTLATAYFLPEQVFGMSEQLGQAFAPMPLPLALFVVAFMPAVCEEMLCRGLFQHTFRKLRRRWVAMLAVAVMFGIMHMNVYRFAATALLGFALAYLREKSGALALPMLMHFINNSFSVAAGRAVDTAAGTATDTLTSAALASTAFFFAMGAPMLIFAGSGLFLPPQPLGRRKAMPQARKVALAVAVAFTALFALGFALTAGSLLDGAPM